MKFTMILLLSLFSFNSFAGFVPMDIKVGMWEYTTDMGKNNFLEDKLAAMPEAQRAMVKKMMAAQMKKMNKPVKQCLTKEQLNNPMHFFKKSSKDCTLAISKSTKSKFEGEMKCKNGMKNVKIDVVAVNSKKLNTTAIINLPNGSKKKITSVGVWLSAGCLK